MGRISEADIDRVRATSDMVAIVGERMSLKRVGRRYSGLCPFHEEKTASFTINPEVQLFHCYGCDRSGNVFQLLMELENIGFADAVESLARRGGISLTYDNESSDDRRRRNLKPKLEKILDVAVEYYSSNLLAQSGGSARRYLSSRGYDKSVAIQFSLGWAPEAWDAGVAHFKKAGFLQEEMLEAGLAVTGSQGGLIDMIRNRVVFPIFDPMGQAIAIAGRALEADAKPKYLNTPETPLYKKSRTLYGLNWAKDTIVSKGEAIIVEGYTDVIGLHLSGFTNAVATCGTALGEEHLNLLKRWTSRVVLAFDGDGPGADASERVYSAAAKFGLDMRVAELPAGQDPADLAASGGEVLTKAFAEPRPLLEFKVDRELGRFSLDSAQAQSNALDSVAAAIALHPELTVRQAAGRSAARYFRDIPEDAILRKVETARHERTPTPRTTTPVATGHGDRQSRLTPVRNSPDRAPSRQNRAMSISRTDGAALAALIQFPLQLLTYAPALRYDWFKSKLAQDIAGPILVWQQSRNGEAASPVNLDQCSLAPDLLNEARRLAVAEPYGFDDLDVFVKEAASALERTYVARRISELQKEMHIAEAGGDSVQVSELDARFVDYIGRRRSLGET